MAEKSATKVVTGVVRLSYPHLFEPAAVNDGEKKKYSCAILIPKSDTATIAKIQAAQKAAAEEGKAKLGGKIPANLKVPLRDGDEEKPEDEAYAGHYFLNATSNTQPQVIDKSGMTLTEEDVYPGCYVRVSLNMYAFNAEQKSKGIAAGLNNVLKVKDGERLDSRTSADEDFAEYIEAGGEDDDLL